MSLDACREAVEASMGTCEGACGAASSALVEDTCTESNKAQLGTDSPYLAARFVGCRLWGSWVCRLSNVPFPFTSSNAWIYHVLCP